MNALKDANNVIKMEDVFNVNLVVIQINKIIYVFFVLVYLVIVKHVQNIVAVYVYLHTNQMNQVNVFYYLMVLMEIILYHALRDVNNVLEMEDALSVYRVAIQINKKINVLFVLVDLVIAKHVQNIVAVYVYKDTNQMNQVNVFYYLMVLMEIILYHALRDVNNVLEMEDALSVYRVAIQINKKINVLFVLVDLVIAKHVQNIVAVYVYKDTNQMNQVNVFYYLMVLMEIILYHALRDVNNVLEMEDALSVYRVAIQINKKINVLFVLVDLVIAKHVQNIVAVYVYKDTNQMNIQDNVNL
ncbi:hypothetical protein IMG5_206830 [Ichthyophthirius multifiliis]|uniref:Transmembrane protein n=1 Tax=Ichthyophthirius multifiliis TaxID=5932 RepID=G0R6N9_ICHMU|nr:hypothetical protein IMG5_206830 [Ichthyophthirius multifiliis]EGR26865.1 hypothetical protein IMG5_206830 [Ichthyophthirius multifiliis]|eukprot:XP_004023749.1 hypothetical protein IMG5_206830 [Ichthyophthirius multifiliis]